MNFYCQDDLCNTTQVPTSYLLVVTLFVPANTNLGKEINSVLV